MKVLFITQTAAIHGGVERWLSNLCVGLAGKGVEVELAFVDGADFHKAAAYLAAYPELAALPHVILRNPSGLHIGRHRALENVIRDRRPDIVVPVLVHETLGAVAACKAAGQKVKLVYPIHENEIWAFDAVAKNMQQIDAVVSVNRLMLDALASLSSWPSERSFHIRCGVDAPLSDRLPGPPAGRLVVGYCGKLVSQQKRAGDLIDFCRRMDACSVPYSLWVAGDGGERAALQNALASQMEDGRVRMLGVLSKDELYREFYPKLDALIITSDWETGPLVAWEAMMHGALVVTSEYRGLRSEGLLRHGETALVFPIGQPGKAADELCAIANDRPALEKIAGRGKLLAEEMLTIDKMIGSWGEVLRAVLELPARAAAKGGHYDIGTSFADLLEEGVRRLLGRPVKHGNAHEEWPRYKPGAVPDQDREGFVRQLNELESALGTTR